MPAKHEFLGTCFLCGNAVFTDDIAMLLHGRYICNKHEVAQQVLALEKMLMNDSRPKAFTK